eukprot:335554-Chlamydomonas_euryale.AAC.7
MPCQELLVDIPMNISSTSLGDPILGPPARDPQSRGSLLLGSQRGPSPCWARELGSWPSRHRNSACGAVEASVAAAFSTLMHVRLLRGLHGTHVILFTPPVCLRLPQE